ncbi:MAG: DUF47 domain-containing protein [Promethearchaeota archaeon]
MGTLLGWFRGRRVSKVISRIKEHAKKAYNCVVQFKNALILFFSEDIKGTQSSIKKVSNIEHECDNLRREIMNSLTKGELSSQIRNDLAHLINHLDNVANSSNSAARNLAILKSEYLRGIQDNLMEMIDKSILCAEILRDTIEIELEGTIEDVDKSISKINKIEHEVDELHYIILKQLQEIEFKYSSAFIALNVHELIECIEGISDACEATADFVKIINLRAVSKNS